MIEITISEQIKKACPDLHIAVIECDVINTPSDPKLWEEITAFENEFRSTYEMAQINKRLPIAATRAAYKAFGKDPNRYRPSAEALSRRVVKEMSLYRIDTLVDLINLVSLKTSFSIGGFDAEKVEGALELSVGKADEKFTAIGRGLLNIEGLPVYRDLIGGIGTPTSDEERTKISLDTKKLLMIINGYSCIAGLIEAAALASTLLNDFVNGKNVTIRFLNSEN
ncbi:MAG: B3/B4 domain-containing protein [Tannerellaceae bacterium]